MPFFGGEVKPLSHVADLNPVITWCRGILLNFTGHFSPIIPTFTNRGYSRRLAWSAFGDERKTETGLVQTATTAEVRKAGFRPAPAMEEEEEEKCFHWAKQTTFYTRSVFFYRSVGICLRLLNPET
jgi:hypothetical protein